MKKISGFVFASAIALAVASCNSSDATKQSSDKTEQTASADGHEHRYACPMHPEVTGKEGDKCPKCGMALEHSDIAPTAAGAYQMQFAATPAAIMPNKEVTLAFTPKKKDAPNEQVALDIEHEKKIHLILVSDDLSWFDHVHPEYNADGSYTVKTKFPAPGKYKAFADYKPTGGTHVVDKIEINVEGTAPTAKSFAAEKLTGNSANYSFSLAPTGGKFVTGAGMHIEGVVKKDGQPIDANSLENYLGAKAHIVVISLNEKEYLHVHPEVANGKFDIHTTFDKPGIYRGWVQFNGDGKLHTIDFTLNVKQGTADDVQKASAAHGTAGSGGDHAGHNH